MRKNEIFKSMFEVGYWVLMAMCFAFIIACALSSCNPDAIDNKIVYDYEGNCYLIEHGLGETYYIRKLDTSQLNKIVKK